MANIILTDACNLRCSYCFAKELVNQTFREITFEDFKEAVNFILKDCSRFGIIGGEPTLYSEFGKVLSYIEHHNRIKHVVIYTNGIKLYKYLDYIRGKKCVFLINCNSPSQIGEKNFNLLCNSIDGLVNRKNLRNNTMLGLNIFRPNMDIKYFVELLKTFGFEFTRISLVVPNNVTDYKTAFDYFDQYRDTMLNIFEKFAEIGVVPNYDCNKIPARFWSDAEKSRIKEMFGERIKFSNIMQESVRCNPIIDINQDLEAVRCFALACKGKVRLSDFKTITEIKQYFIKEIDETILSEYNYCSLHENICYGGCLTFKSSQNK